MYAVSREWIDRLKKVFEELGISYEIEEAVRIHINDMIVQISEGNEGEMNVSISVALPSSEVSVDDVSKYARDIEKAFNLAARLNRGELLYELDTSLPSYPTLYITRVYRDKDALVNDLINALRSVVHGSTVSSH